MNATVPGAAQRLLVDKMNDVVLKHAKSLDVDEN